MTIHIRLFLIILAATFQPIYSLADGVLKTYVNEEGVYLCLSYNEVGLAGLFPEQENNLLTKSDVINKLGKPDRVEGNSDFSSSYYGKTKLEYGNDYVCSISTTSQSVQTPAGIRPGLSRQELFSILGYETAIKNLDVKSAITVKETYTESRELRFMTCEGAFLGGGLTITFDQSEDRIEKLYAGIDCP